MREKINQDLESLVMNNLPEIADLFIEIGNSEQLTEDITFAIRDILEEQYKYMMRKVRKIEKISKSINI